VREYNEQIQQQSLMEEEFKWIKNCWNWLRQEVFKPEKEITVYLPIHIPRLIHQAKQIHYINSIDYHDNKSNIIPHELVD